ncbi:MAG TPA: hypothetical protein VK654_07560 [Nitrospirota bacterium]|nr:hypothetical protein [Nitrospirota bacterium]
MNTMFDFITHVKGVEYLLSLVLIAGYLLVWEVLKPRPFHAIREAGRDDLAHFKRSGVPAAVKQLGRIVSAPFVGLFYIVSLPFTMAGAVAYAVYAGLAGREAAFTWRPAEAYLTGKKNNRKSSALSDKK